MTGKVIVLGDVTSRHEVEELVAQRHPELSLDSVGQGREFVERACSGTYDVALLLRGPMAEHQQRMDAVGSLRRNSFKGRILVAASFLTERHEATGAGADYVFDPDRQAVEQVVKAALIRPTSAADHPYLRYLLVGEWTTVTAYGDELPGRPPNLLMAATSCHEDPGFFKRLAEYTRVNPGTHCILVEDGGTEDAEIEALSSGVQPHVTVAEEGLAKVASLASTFLREAWLRNVTAA